MPWETKACKRYQCLKWRHLRGLYFSLYVIILYSTKRSIYRSYLVSYKRLSSPPRGEGSLSSLFHLPYGIGLILLRLFLHLLYGMEPTSYQVLRGECRPTPRVITFFIDTHHSLLVSKISSITY